MYTRSIMRHVDISPLEQKIRKLEVMRELLADPEMVQLFLQMVSSNGQKPLQTAKTLTKTNSATRSTTQRGELFEAAKQVADGIPGKFKSRDLLKQLKGHGYQLAAKREDVAISGVLKRLVAHNILKRSGTRGKMRYEVIRQTSSA
jgi:hypothetical protein